MFLSKFSSNLTPQNLFEPYFSQNSWGIAYGGSIDTVAAPGQPAPKKATTAPRNATDESPSWKKGLPCRAGGSYQADLFFFSGGKTWSEILDVPKYIYIYIYMFFFEKRWMVDSYCTICLLFQISFCKMQHKILPYTTKREICFQHVCWESIDVRDTQHSHSIMVRLTWAYPIDAMDEKIISL